MHIRTKLEMMFTKAAQSPTLIKNLGSVGLEVIGGSGALAFERIKNERTYWAPVVKASGISLND